MTKEQYPLMKDELKKFVSLRKSNKTQLKKAQQKLSRVELTLDMELYDYWKDPG